MRRLLVLLLAVGLGVVVGRMFNGVPSTAEAGGGKGGGDARCAAENGDVNADGEIDISDCITILTHLFLGDPTELVPLCGTPADPSGLPDTGQTTCHDAGGNLVDCASDTCAGQDGFYQTGCSNEGRFTDNGDGTVTDNCMGLMWQKDTGNDGIILDGCSALAYCENLELAGHTDWRLPNIRELQSILKYGWNHPMIDRVFGAFLASYWSSTSVVARPPADMWIVDFRSGQVFLGRGGLVRAVRFNQTDCSIEGRFTDNGDGTVTDNCTGLMWQMDTGNDGNSLDWCSALAYCENLELAGHTDWRLPNVRELQSIVEYGRMIDPAIDPAFGSLSSEYWSSTSYYGNNAVADAAFYVRFFVGNVAFANKVSGFHVRAVRSGT